MRKLSKQVRDVLKEGNDYHNNMSLYRDVISYIPYFKNIKEEDYIIYHGDNTFEYTPQFYSFIKSLFDAGLVESVGNMEDFLTSYNSKSAYKLWMRDLNIVLDDKNILADANISVLKKIIFSLLRLESVLQGSWGIDAESGNWLKILMQLCRILPADLNSEDEMLN